MHFDFLIELLTSLKAQGALGTAKLIGGTATTLFALYNVIRARARWRYRRALEREDELKADLQNETAARKDRDKQIADLRTEVSALQRDSAAGFLKAMAVHKRDGNLEFENRDAKAYVERESEAIYLAFYTLANARVMEASEDGAAGFEDARRYALAALAVRPGDAELRELIGELTQASAAAAAGAKPRLRPDERSERIARQAQLPNNLVALQRCYEDAFARGNYRLAKRFADHAYRMAKRAEGPLSRNALIFEYFQAQAVLFVGSRAQAGVMAAALLPKMDSALGVEDPYSLSTRYLCAQCLHHLGQPEEALSAVETLLLLSEQVSGAEHHNILNIRHLRAQCLYALGQPGEALAEVETLLPLREQVSGAEHHDTLNIRHLRGQCLRALRQLEEALSEAEALLPLEEKVKGAEHPDTLTTRQLFAEILADLGRDDDARDAFAGVLEGYAKAGIAEEARSVRDANATHRRLYPTPQSP